MTADFTTVLPELLMAIAAMALLMLGVFRGEKGFDLVNGLTVLVLLAVAGYLVSGASGAGSEARLLAFDGLFVVDHFGIFAKVLILVGAALTLMMASNFLKDTELDRFEFPVLALLATLGMMLMVSANDFIALYVGLELQSLALYVLAAFQRDRGRSTEAGLKYFVLGALSSGLLLFGTSYIYGFTGTTNFDELAHVIHSLEGLNIGLTVGLVFVMCGLAFKIAAVPFHMWSPDVYEGAPTPVTAFFAAAPKVAALALMVRVLMSGFGELASAWMQIVIFLSIASMLVGAFVALVQTNLKRLIAYSSIGHVGYALVGLAASGQQMMDGKLSVAADGIEALLLYIAIYLTMTVGTFGVLLSMRRGGAMCEAVSDLSGLARTNLPMAVAMATLMFSLAGIPLLAGFFGKWYVFLAAVEAGLWPLALVGVVTSVVGAYYYLRIVKTMFFDDPETAFDKARGKALPAVVGASALVNSPISYLVLIGPLSLAAAWAANALLL